MSMNGEIEHGQSGSLLGLWVHPQQELVRKLISGPCSWRPKSNVQDVSFWVIRDADRLHGISPPAPTNLVSGENKVVLYTIGRKTKAHYNDKSAVRMWEPTIVPVIQIHRGPDRVLKPASRTDRLQDLRSPLLHLRVLLTNMVPAFLSKINLMAQLVSYKAAHHTNSVHNILSKGATESEAPFQPWRRAKRRLVPNTFAEVMLILQGTSLPLSLSRRRGMLLGRR
jgi:hypothetical protein